MLPVTPNFRGGGGQGPEDLMLSPAQLVLFVALFGGSLYLMFYISVGLDQELALPEDSYLLDYFLFLNKYFEVGAPVYFVTTGGYNFSSVAGMNGICSSAGCDDFSLTQKIQYATEFPEMSYLAIPASSWVDDFIDWLTPSSCCRIYTSGSNKDKFCPSTISSLSCLKNCMGLTMGPVRPSVEQFHEYLPWFLKDPPNIKCPKGLVWASVCKGRIAPLAPLPPPMLSPVPKPHWPLSSLSSRVCGQCGEQCGQMEVECGGTSKWWWHSAKLSVEGEADDGGGGLPETPQWPLWWGLTSALLSPVLLPRACPASRFMTYSKPLKNSQDYTEALRATRALADNITASLREVPGTDPDFEVFPYTITNVFYEQYLTIIPEGLFMLALCLAPTFIVCFLLLGMDLRSGLLNLFSIVMILVDTVGFMALWDISYNAVSLINLVTAVGISVEFVSHITRSFAISTKPTRLERAKEATITMGSAVFAGVAMTNLPGILVLGLAKSQLVQIFFFRLNLLVTLLGLLHGLVFLPVVLSYLGPDVNPALVLEQKRAEEEEAAAREASCPKHPSVSCTTDNTYVNSGFEDCAKGTSGIGRALRNTGPEI
ncbi:NPC1-like intracellular cholesterol transporter 1 [Choloepus didactylus]|uniref:NPC1-like intracellular cholesterol transporter 1 n=1 Tax=Choloepus didactylus TaxID=27675 RepID=UPI00189F1401|nr:NPC1-like intracellular cholesterol transporter 1 [Choloepus didactylus]